MPNHGLCFENTLMLEKYAAGNLVLGIPEEAPTGSMAALDIYLQAVFMRFWVPAGKQVLY